MNCFKIINCCIVWKIRISSFNPLSNRLIWLICCNCLCNSWCDTFYCLVFYHQYYADAAMCDRYTSAQRCVNIEQQQKKLSQVCICIPSSGESLYQLKVAESNAVIAWLLQAVHLSVRNLIQRPVKFTHKKNDHHIQVSGTVAKKKSKWMWYTIQLIACWE